MLYFTWRIKKDQFQTKSASEERKEREKKKGERKKVLCLSQKTHKIRLNPIPHSRETSFFTGTKRLYIKSMRPNRLQKDLLVVGSCRNRHSSVHFRRSCRVLGTDTAEEEPFEVRGKTVPRTGRPYCLGRRSRLPYSEVVEVVVHRSGSGFSVWQSSPVTILSRPESQTSDGVRWTCRNLCEGGSRHLAPYPYCGTGFPVCLGFPLWNIFKRDVWWPRSSTGCGWVQRHLWHLVGSSTPSSHPQLPLPDGTGV